MPSLEVADIFRAHGADVASRCAGTLQSRAAWEGQRSAIEQCRSAALGGHSLRCSACAQPQIAYNSCRNRHCPEVPVEPPAQRWLRKHRQADLLPVPFITTLWSSLCRYTDQRHRLHQQARHFMLCYSTSPPRRCARIAADPKHFKGARIGTTSVLHTWGSALTHHPHVHGIVPGGGARGRCRSVGAGASRDSFCRYRYCRVCFWRRFLEGLPFQNLHRDGQLKFFGEHIDLSDADAFADHLA